jgi:hypothetical protein
MLRIVLLWVARLYFLIRYRFNVGRFSNVESGPFAGMRMCEKGSWGGHKARLLGTYEKEIAHIVSSIDQWEIDHVIDVGCADGYYSCGFAYRYPNLSVSAYDISTLARCCTYFAARANKVNHRLSVCNRFDVNVLLATNKERILLFLDCEGCESHIITDSSLPLLRNVAILVECHEMYVSGVTERIKKALIETHAVDEVHTANRTIEDAPHGMHMRPKILVEMDECREGDQSWIWAVPKKWVKSDYLATLDVT